MAKTKTPRFSANRALKNALSSARVVASEDPEDEDSEEIGIVDMAEYAQDMAHWLRQLDLHLRRGGRLPRRWRAAGVAR